MTKLSIALAALTSTAVIAVGAPLAYASHGPDDGPTHDSGHDTRDDHGHDSGDDHGRHTGDDDGPRGGRGHHGHEGHRGDDGRQAGRDRVVQSGTCSSGARWTAKVKADDGALEVEGEVDSGVSGQTWAWTITDNGTTDAQGSAVTGTRSGSFSVERAVADRPGADTVVFSATTTGQVCAGSLTF